MSQYRRLHEVLHLSPPYACNWTEEAVIPTPLTLYRYEMAYPVPPFFFWFRKSGKIKVQHHTYLLQDLSACIISGMSILE